MQLMGALSIRKKLMMVLLLTSISVLLFSSISFLINDWYSLRSAIFERLRAQADIVGNSSVSAVVFNDSVAAERTLSILESEADIQAAALFDHEGKLFVQYEREPGALLKQLPDTDVGDINGHVFVVSPIAFNDEAVGDILPIADMREWTRSQMSNLLTAIAVFLFSLLMAVMISSRLQQASRYLVKHFGLPIQNVLTNATIDSFCPSRPPSTTIPYDIAYKWARHTTSWLPQ